MRRQRHIGRGVVAWALAAMVVLGAGAAAAGTKDLTKELDAVAAAAFAGDGPGAAVLVVRDGKILLRKGYGLADLELGVAVRPEMVFRIGSITKQFTAVAVLMLAEEGKLDLASPITTYLPEYPEPEAVVTVEHLLTHTSGIPSYTDLAEWLPLQRKDMSLEELIDMFKDRPLEFSPGERWAYNNSGYILLGAIIEQASGMSYQEFVRRRIFEPLGMTSSYYGDVDPIIPGRVRGYARGKDGFINAPYLSMTQPYSAGSLMSTVDDLAVWNEALFAGSVVKSETLRRALAPFRLSDGRSTGYGFGWMMSSHGGHALVEHGGGIHGFTCHAIAVPEEKAYVVVLTNSTAGGERSPEAAAFRLAALALGAPYVEPVAAPLAPEQAAALAGVYAGPDEQKVFIRTDGSKVLYQRTGGSVAEIFQAANGEFFFPRSFTRLHFDLDAAGTVTGLRVVTRVGMERPFVRTSEELPAERQAVAVAAEILRRYVGEYEIAPGFTLTVSLDGSQLMLEPTGQPLSPIFPESETEFFLKIVDARLVFEVDETGGATGLVLYQAGREMAGRRLR